MVTEYMTADWTDDRVKNGEVNNTADPQLFRKERFGAFNYTFPNLDNGLYEVAISMAESYWTQPKERGFYIQVQVSTQPAHWRRHDTAPAGIRRTSSWAHDAEASAKLPW